MSNIDGDAQEFDDLNSPIDGMPDPLEGMPDPTASAPTTQPDLAEEDEAVDDSLENLADEDDAKKPAVKKAGLATKVVLASPYTVMLAISVLAIGVALICLMLEWGTYSYQRKPPKNLTINRVENTRFLAVSAPNSPDNRPSQVDSSTS